MAYFEFQWTDEIIEHLAEHEVRPEEFEEIVSFPDRRGKSRTSGSPCCWGETCDGRYLFCVYEQLDPVTIIPVTAYDVSRRGE